MWDRFASSDYRVYRACKFFLLENEKKEFCSFLVVLFITFGVFGFIPTCHYVFRFGVEHAFTGMIDRLTCLQALYHEDSG